MPSRRGGRTAEESAVFDNLRRLARLRAELSPLRRGRLVTLAVTEQAWAYARVLGDQAVVVVLNNAAHQCRSTSRRRPRVGPRTGRREPAGRGRGRIEGARLRVSLGPRSAAIYTAR